MNSEHLLILIRASPYFKGSDYSPCISPICDLARFLSVSLSLCLCLFLCVFLFSLFLFFFVFLFVCLCVCLSYCLSASLSLCLFLSFCLPLSLSVFLSLCLSLSVYLCLSVCLSVCLFVCLLPRFFSKFKALDPKNFTDNTSVNIYRVGEELVAATETDTVYTIDPSTLESSQPVSSCKKC